MRRGCSKNRVFCAEQVGAQRGGREGERSLAHYPGLGSGKRGDREGNCINVTTDSLFISIPTHTVPVPSRLSLPLYALFNLSASGRSFSHAAVTCNGSGVKLVMLETFFFLTPPLLTSSCLSSPSLYF